jgi:predicted enzyme related to lactoylglutathione lyase
MTYFNKEFSMQSKRFDLGWIMVKDLKKAVQFYTDTVGLKLLHMMEEPYGWAELVGHDGGATLGIAEARPGSDEPISPGQNAVPTFTYAKIETAKAHVEKSGGVCKGPVVEVPGHVKMQTVVDPDGNHFQLVETLSE